MSAPRAISRRSPRARPTRSSRRATPSAAPGTCSATPASAPTRTCSRSGYDFRPWEEGKAIADGPSIRSYVRDDRARPRSRGQDPLPPPGGSGRVVVARTPAGPCDAERTDTGETVELTCSFLYGCTGYYRYDEGYPPALRGHRALPRTDHPPAALARGPRLRRQARGRDRQRRHRRHARAGDGRARRSRDDAPALAELRRHAARGGPDRELPAARAARRRRPTRSSAGRTCC